MKRLRILCLGRKPLIQHQQNIKVYQAMFLRPTIKKLQICNKLLRSKSKNSKIIKSYSKVEKATTEKQLKHKELIERIDDPKRLLKEIDRERSIHKEQVELSKLLSKIDKAQRSNDVYTSIEKRWGDSYRNLQSSNFSFDYNIGIFKK